MSCIAEKHWIKRNVNWKTRSGRVGTREMPIVVNFVYNFSPISVEKGLKYTK